MDYRAVEASTTDLTTRERWRRRAPFVVAASRCGVALLGIVAQIARFLVVFAVDGHGWHRGVCWRAVGHVRIGDEVVVDEKEWVDRGPVQKGTKDVRSLLRLPCRRRGISDTYPIVGILNDTLVLERC